MERSTTLRFFLFPAEGGLRRLSHRVINGLIQGTDRLPQYAGQRIRIGNALVALIDGELDHLAAVEGSWWEIDRRGGAQIGLLRSLSETLRDNGSSDTATDGATNIVDIAGILAKRRLSRRWRWTPTPVEITAIVHAIWPESAGREVKLPPFERGASKRRFPVSYEADEAASRCNDHIDELRQAVRYLSDRDLKGILTRVEEEAQPVGEGDEHLWRGLGDYVEWMLKARKARRSTRGTWYAWVDMWTRTSNERLPSWEVRRVEHCACKGRAEAETACREYLAKYAGHFSYHTKFEIDLCPEIEWDGDGDDEEALRDALAAHSGDGAPELGPA